jgi:acyl-coenzyme A thioesterase PaaI-like protein
MWALEKASRAMGMKIEKVGPGFAILSMSVGVDMVNGHGLCHGGFIFSLADSALAFACNSHHRRHVAIDAGRASRLSVALSKGARSLATGFLCAPPDPAPGTPVAAT